MRMKETQKERLFSKSVVNLRSYTKILVLLNSYHVAPKTVIITGIN